MLDVRTGDVREAKFYFGRYQPLANIQRTFGKISMFRTVDIDPVQGPRVSPVYFIDNQTEEIIAE